MSSLRFLSFFCCISIIISAACTQSKSEWDSKKIKTEFLRMNDRISLLSQEIANLKSSEWNSQVIKNEFIKMNKKYTYLSQQIHEFKDLFETKTTEEHSETTSISSSTQPLLIGTHFNASHEFYYDKEEPDFIWTINALKNRTKEKYFELLSEVFPLKRYSFGAQVRLTLDENNKELAISLLFKDINNGNNGLYSLRLLPEVFYTLRDEQSREISRRRFYPFTSVLRYDRCEYSTWIILLKRIENDEDITVEIHVEPPEDALRSYSHDGILEWAIGDLGLMRKEAAGELGWTHNSPYFYTSSPEGYRVQVEIVGRTINEEGEEDVCVSIAFLTGVYDADLPRSFKHKTIVTLFHPTDPGKRVVRSVRRDLKDEKHYAIRMGVPKGIDHFLSGGHTLYYRVQIVPA